MIWASGLGPVPGTDPREAARWIVDAVPGLPHVPELPGRGPWARPVARAAAMLVDLDLALTSQGWEATAGRSRDQARARSLLAEDLDAVEECWAGWTGQLKAQVCGPWSLAAAVERPSGEVLASDEAAVRDVAQSLAEGLAAHCAQLLRRVPGASRCLVELAEPRLGALLSGEVPTRSGLSLLAPVEPVAATAALATVVSGLRSLAVPCSVVVRTAGHDAAVAVGSDAGADGWAGDLDADEASEALAGWVERGAAVVLGCGSPGAGDAALAAVVRDRFSRWGLPLGCPSTLVLTSSAALDQGTREAAQAAYREVATAAARLSDEVG